MPLFGRRRAVEPPSPAPEPADQGEPPVTFTIGRELGNDAPVRWALLDRAGFPGSLAVIAPYDARSRFFERALPEISASGPVLALDPLELLGTADRLAAHRLGAGRGVDLNASARSETADIALSASAIAWWAASGAAWSGAVEAILEQTIDSLARAGEAPSAERIAHLLREAAARSQDPELRGGCARIGEGLFATLGSDEARALFSDPAGPLPGDRDLAISIALEVRGSREAVRLAQAGLLRLAARLVAARSGGSALLPSLTDLGPGDLVERLAADLLWPLRNVGTGVVIGADALAPWTDRPGVASAILARADAWLVAVGEEQRGGWETVLGERGDPVAMSESFDAILAAGGDAALIAPAVRREPIGLRAFGA
jgi:hypothetical protein